ncbi:uncharacterized protein LOC143549354 [Bidens hawaiensis]|uniref:uncharacterized protein LOC143549354 n=1 Tax=Bidens hawaiensis TaxID=980011 RepID=UPI00404B9281
MNLLSLNCRGSGARGTYKLEWIRNLRRSNNINLFCGQETQLANKYGIPFDKSRGNSQFESVRLVLLVDQAVFFAFGILRLTLFFMRKALWSDLLTLMSGVPGCWVFLGDINETRFKEDRLPASGYASDIVAFNSFIQGVGLSEYNMGGRSFTWMSDDGCHIKIDRFLVYLSDVVMRSWVGVKSRRSGELNLMWKLKQLKTDIKAWIARSIDVVEAEQLQLSRLGLKWLAKVWWDAEGDENSKFYHGVVNGNIKRSTINGILVNRKWETDYDLLKDGFFNFFSNKFEEPFVERPELGNSNFKRLSYSDIVWLERPFSMSEVKNAVWECGNDKSPGPDGFTFKFIKTFWEVLGNDFFEFVKDFEKFGYLEKCCNSAFNSLIPKKKDPMAFSDYRPINLIGSMFKVISKLIAIMLKKKVILCSLRMCDQPT